MFLLNLELKQMDRFIRLKMTKFILNETYIKNVRSLWKLLYE